MFKLFVSSFFSLQTIFKFKIAFIKIIFSTYFKFINITFLRLSTYVHIIFIAILTIIILKNMIFKFIAKEK